MLKSDAGHTLTDAELKKLEQRITQVYQEAADDMSKDIKAYFEKLEEREEKTRKLIGTIVNGKEYTEEDFLQWRLNQIGRGERMEALRDKLAQRVTEANEVAVSYINDTTPGIYSLNRNYANYTIEQLSDSIDFALWDEQTVKRLITEAPDLMPSYPAAKAVKRGIDLAYGKTQITKQVTTGILKGESIKKISDRLQTNIPTMERDSAVRAARTAVTGAQNAGRLDSFKAAEEAGINIRKTWMATLDNRTRHTHQKLDGQTVDVGDSFEVEGYSIQYPGDPGGAPEMVYNCRCTMIREIDGISATDGYRRTKNEETGETELVKWMTYDEWVESKNGI
jgi:SPP1 gp7 family putative phage head morphogenesis protein